ncbi:unnamed protein product [Linum tenue]|uniref:Uncharacterized protein n=1 Tax=Linum tenue TaxID=586396 RepID=A0AAV0MX62_9ROSI|nr:unnamed protein product [Linum tenue]
MEEACISGSQLHLELPNWVCFVASYMLLTFRNTMAACASGHGREVWVLSCFRPIEVALLSPLNRSSPSFLGGGWRSTSPANSS